MENGNPCVLITFPESFLFVFFLLLLSVPRVLLRGFVFGFRGMDFGVKKSVHMFSGVAWIRLTYSFISALILLQRVFVMLHFPVEDYRCLSVS